MAAPDHPLVQDYLARLRAESRRLAPDEAYELEAQIREHLTEALPHSPGEITVRKTLERLGTPADLVDAAGESPAQPAAARNDPSSPSGSDTRWREAAALLALVGTTLFALIAPLGFLLWLAGMYLLFTAPRWSTSEKVLGAVVLGPAGLLPIAAGLAMVRGSGTFAFATPVAAMALVAWSALFLLALLYLAVVAARRP